MAFLRRSFLLLAGLALVVLLSSCGGATSTGSSSSYNQPAPTTSVSSSVKTASVTVGGKAVTVLTNAQGMTLYYYTPDTATKAACTGNCAGNWPPVLFTGSGAPKAAVKLPGELEVYPNTNGKQIIYNDHPLYTFKGDTATGQTNGQGVGGKWFVATTDLAKNTTASVQSTPTVASASTGSLIVKTASVTVGSKAVTILSNAQGMTLYYFTPDTATKTACTGNCAETWPPVLFTGSGAPKAAVKLPGELEVYPNINGKQIIYNDHPLYTFSGDTAAGQTNGQGIGGKWFVATTDLAKNTKK